MREGRRKRGKVEGSEKGRKERIKSGKTAERWKNRGFKREEREHKYTQKRMRRDTEGRFCVNFWKCVRAHVNRHISLHKQQRLIMSLHRSSYYLQGSCRGKLNSLHTCWLASPFTNPDTIHTHLKMTSELAHKPKLKCYAMCVFLQRFIIQTFLCVCFFPHFTDLLCSSGKYLLDY